MSDGYLWKEGWRRPLLSPRREALPPEALFALERLEERGFEAALVGGCVRDMLLFGRDTADWDIATSALPEEVAAAFPGERVLPTGVRHGTVTLVRNRVPIEITTFRRDGDYGDMRRPDSVSFTRSLRQDVARRDFTMNAVAWERGAGLIDHVGGLEDLARGRIRAVGDPRRRFSEDALRVMRALRFAAQLPGFAIEPGTEAAVRELYPNLRRIAPERLWREMGKIGLAGWAALLRGYPEVLRMLLPALGALPREAAERAARRAELLAGGGEPGPWPGPCRAEPPADNGGADPRWAALLFEAGEDAAAETLRGLRADRRTVEETRACVALARRARADMAALRRLTGEARALSARLRGVDARRLMGCAADIAFAFDPERREAARRLLAEIEARSLPCGLDDLPVTGGDLARLGLRGPALGAALQTLLDEVLRGSLPNDRIALLERARRLS